MRVSQKSQFRTLTVPGLSAINTYHYGLGNFPNIRIEIGFGNIYIYMFKNNRSDVANKLLF